MAQSLKEGILPLWNPHVFSGFPVFANGATTLFSPWSLLYAYLPFFTAYKVQWFLTFFIGGVLFYIFLSRFLNLRRMCAFLGTFVYLFCPFLIENVDMDSVLGFLWVYPAVLMLTERYFKNFEFKYLLWLSMLLAASCYFTHIHVAFNAVLLFLIYGGCRWFFLERSGGRKSIFWHLPLMGVFFLGLSAAALLPFLEFLFHSQRGFTEGSGGDILLPAEIFAAFYPIVPKIPHINQILSQISSFVFSTPVTLHARGVYLGVLPALFSVVGIWTAFPSIKLAKFRKEGIWALLVLLYFIFNIFPVSKIHPVFDLLTARYWTIYIFSLSVLTGVVLDFLFSDFHPNTKLKFRSATRGLLYLFILPVTLISVFISLFRSRIVQYALSKIDTISNVTAQELSQQELTDRITERLDTIFNLVSIQSPFILLPFILILVFYLFLRFRERIPVVFQFIVILFLLFTDLLFVGSKFRPTVVSENLLFPESKAIAFMKKEKGLFRFASLQPERGGKDVVLKPNLGIFYDLYDVGGQESVIDRRYLKFSRRALQKRMNQPVTGSGILDFQDIDLKLAGMLHVKYLVQGEKNLHFSELEPVFHGEGMKIFENPFLFPKVFFVSGYQWIRDEESVLNLLSDPRFDPKKTVIFEEEPHRKLSRQADTEILRGQAKINQYLPNEIKLSVKSENDSYLVLTDSYYPGWKAYVDGEVERIYRANGVLRAIFVPKGAHAVDFVYRPKSLLLGSLLSALALIFVFFAFAVRSLLR